MDEMWWMPSSFISISVGQSDCIRNYTWTRDQSSVAAGRARAKVGGVKGFETGPRLLLMLPDLEPGGMPTRFLTIARAAAARGTGVTLVSGDGPLRGVAAAVCDLELVDWAGPRAETLAAVCEAADGHRAAVVALAPETVHVLGGLAARTALHICAHNPPGTFPGAWPAAALERL